MEKGIPGKRFKIHSQAWYAGHSPLPKGAVDEIDVIATDPNSPGAALECCISWVVLGNRTEPRLEIFADSWALLDSDLSFAGKLAYLGLHYVVGGEAITVEKVIVALVEAGFVDATERVNPHPNRTGNEDEEREQATLISLIKRYPEVAKHAMGVET